MRVLVTGGGGFLGGALAARLLADGHEVGSFARGDYPALAASGVRVYRGDLADAGAVAAAVAGADVVFHAAARAGIAGRRAQFVAANVTGTRNVLAACRRHRVGVLVHTSTPSVAHAGESLRGVDESVGQARRFDADYPATKAVAEREVLAANGPGLATVALRPHLMWGPGDTQLVPRILARARAGRLRLVDGGRAVVDATYIDNAVQAHLAAAGRLLADGPAAACAGRAYFIAQGEPLPIGDWVDQILAADGQPPVRASLPAPVAVAVGAVLEAGFRRLAPQVEPPMTRFLAHQLSTDHWFDLSGARRDVGYRPVVEHAEGMRRLAAWLAGQRELRTG